VSEKVAVLGGGSWGTTLAHLLAQNGHETHLWMRRKEIVDSINEEHENPRYLPGLPLHEGVRATLELEQAVRGTPFIIVAIPSSAFRKVMATASEFLEGDQVLLSATKGFEKESHQRMTEVLRSESCVKKVGALSGPNLAKEVMAGSPAATVIASNYNEVIKLGAQLLHSKRFRVYGNDDVIGAEVGGALKNIIAIASGVCDGLGFGNNTKSLLMTRGLAEISRFGCLQGAQPITFSGLAGIGDLMVTCASPMSRNYRVGNRLGKGETLEAILESMIETAEGVKTTAIALQIAEEIGAALPIAAGVGRLLYEGAKTDEVLAGLMSRSAKYELTGAPNYADSVIALDD